MADRKILSETCNKSKARNNLILQFNYFLDKNGYYFSLNEKDLENLIAQLDNLVLVKDIPYWLTLARINELILLCAENYANNSELALVEDLLLNPRLVLVHVNGSPKPIAKKRHLSFMEQFRGVAEDPQAVMDWLEKETFIEIKTEALLPHLFQKLESSGYFHWEYLETLDDRKAKITELIDFLSDRGLKDSLDFFHWIKKAAPSDREMLNTKLCCCNLDLYFELGLQVNDLAKGASVSHGFEPGNSKTINPAKLDSWIEQSH
ncbi:MAG: hypothetical protein C0407_06215 [Desulfobacca sp.]|nr:hypothetical protein [Desulfobacca sp.]